MNSLILVLIIGIVSAVIRQSRDVSKGKSQTKPFSMNRGDLQDAYKKLKEKVVSKATDPFHTTASFPSNKKVTEPKKQVEETTVVTSVANGEITPYKPENTLDKLSDSKSPGQQKLIDAVIWSEILGEPRAKKPHVYKKR